MNKIIGSWITKLLALLVGYASAVSVARAVDTRFAYYTGRNLWDGLWWGWLRMGVAVSLPLFAACAALFLISVWKSKGKKPPAWRNIDLTLLAVWTYCVIPFSMSYALYTWQYSISYSMQLLLLSAAVYIAVMAFLAEATARIRDRQLTRTLYWPRFFKLYPLQRPIGLLIALLLAGNLFYLFIICSVFVIRSHGSLDTTVFLFSAFTVSALTYCCTFMLSLSAEYDKANAEKIRAERFKSELITNVSHDIRTPLTSIINYVDLLKALPVEQKDFLEYVNVLDKKSSRLKTLINDLMEASKAATGNVVVNLREIDLSEIVGQIAGEFEDQFAERGLAFVLRQPDEQVFVHADSNHLWRALENLFGNAAKYALSGTRVFAEIGLHGGKTVLLLKNTSQNPIDLPTNELTEQFMRGDRARQTDGSGLGLYIVKGLVELMGGQFTIRVSGDLFEVEIVFG